MKPGLIREHACAICAALILSATQPIVAADETPKVDRIKIVEAVSPSLVQVEYTLKYDSGEEPSGGGWGEKCPNCGEYHGASGSGTFVKEERPLTAAGYLIEGDIVVTGDVQMHPRFIKSIAVRFGGKTVEAAFAGYAKKQPATFLKLSAPLDGARPLRFDSSAKGPHFVVTYADQDARWIAGVGSLSTNIAVTDGGVRFVSCSSSCVITDGAGVPVAVTLNGVLPTDESWRGSPAAWARVSAEEYASIVAEASQRCESGILRAFLSFRSPKKSARQSSWMDDDDSNEAATQMNVVALVLDDKRALVLANLKRKATSRLERVTLYGPDGASWPAKFSATLLDYGAFLVDMEKPAPGSIALSDTPASSHRGEILLKADIEMRGENRIAYYDHARIASFERRWGGMILPELIGDSENQFLFDGQGRLAAFHIARRQKVTEKEEYGSDPTILLPAAVLRGILADGSAHFDSNNVPLSEAEENRIAWLGIESQPLSAELARANNVSDKTRDGEIGTMVAYVYPDSPAAAAGIQAGDILVQLRIDGQPKPLEVNKEESFNMFGGSFPWDRWDELPEQYFDDIPTPWPTADNQLARSLTELGFGKKFTAEVYRDGKLETMPFTITESPAHYDSAKRYKSDALGLTIRDITYEVRRYFQMENDAPGVIISKIEPGGKASVGGLKPYEVITHVGDIPVANAAEFEKAIEAKTSLRFSVKRMTKGRIVKLKLSKEKSGQASKDQDAESNKNPAATSQPE